MTHPDTTPLPAEADDFRLGYSVAPRRYELHLAPDLAAATFAGTVTVEIEIREPVGAIVMNALDLEISDASLALGWASEGDDPGPAESFSLGVEMDVDTERVTFAAPSEDVPPGRYRLSCSFTGELNDKLCGFYRSVYVDDAGVEHVIATTQFEDTDARRAFPCFDEPDRKAVFSVTLDAPPGMLAVSNGPEVSSEELPGGARRVRFGDTIPMSTYLVACVVGPLEATDPVDVDGVALRVVHQPGKAGLTAPALDAARHALGFYTEYFGIAYPGTKLDLVAIPDFAAGAMENLGCVTFRDAVLLADPERTSRVEMERITEVVEHELAHMWFGDLVTMRWWNGIWLNEAFATFMALCCQDDYRPEWEVFTAFARDRSAALGIDGLHATRPIEYPVRSPDEATAMFDVLTYEKGATILWMLEQYLGRESFRDGVRRYLAAHSYANTETHDLWDAIAAVAGDVPIREIMDSWIFQGGFPVVAASERLGTDGAGGVELAQSPFSYLPGPLPWPGESGGEAHSAVGSGWVVPVLVAPAGGSDGPARLLLGRTPVQLDEQPDAVVVNAGGSGFYRLSYDPSLRSALLATYESLQPIERYNVVSDSWALCLADRAPLASAFELFDRVAAETDPYVWSVVTGALGLVDLLAPEELRGRVAAFTRGLLAPQLARVGWDAATGEDEKDRLLRSTLISALGTFGRDPAVASQAHAAFVADHDGTSQVPPDIAAAVLGVVAHHAGEQELDAILERYRRPLDPIDESRHVTALGRVGDVELAARVHRLTLSEIRSQNAPYVLASMLSVRAIGPATWQHIASSLEQMIERYPANSIHRMLEGIPALAQVDESGAPLHAEEVRAVVGAKIHGGRRRLVAQSLERLEVNVRLARRLPKELDDALPR